MRGEGKGKRGERRRGTWATFGLVLAMAWLLGQGVGLGAIGGEFLITPEFGRQGYPAVAYDPASQRFLVIYDDENGIKGQLLDARGNRVGLSFTLSTNSNYYTVAYDSVNQRFLVVWMWGGWDNWDIWGQLVNADGTLFGTGFAISMASGHQWFPSAAYDSASQRFLVVWGDRRASSYDIYGQRVGADGSLVGTEIAIDTGVNTQLYPVVDCDSANQRFLVAYRDGSSFSGQQVGADGSLVGTKFQILSDAACCWGAVAYDTTRRRFMAAGAVWSSGDQDIWGQWVSAQWVNADGTLFGTPFFLSTRDNLSNKVSAAYDPAGGRFLVAWGDSGGGKGDLYGRQVNADGTLFPDREAPLSTARPWEGNPAVAYDSVNRRFLVAWEDHRDNSDIYGLLLIGLPVRPMASLSLNAESFRPGDLLNLDLRLLTPPHTLPAGNWSFEVAHWLKTPLDFPVDLLSLINIGGPGNQVTLPPGFDQTISLLHLPALPSVPAGSYKFGIRLNHTITREELSLDEVPFEITSP